MRKIPTIFEREWHGDRSRITPVPHKECGWVFEGEGVPTRKLDGSCCLIRNGRLYKRRELKPGSATPVDFEAVGFDPETGKAVGWVPVGDGPEDKWHREGLANLRRSIERGQQAWGNSLEPPRKPRDGTYELVGPHVQGGVEKWPEDILIPHDDGCLVILEPVPRDYGLLPHWLAGRDIEGIVFHHPDGRMAKIKLRDFGLKRGRPA